VADIDNRELGTGGGRELDRFVQRVAAALGTVGGYEDLFHRNLLSISPSLAASPWEAIRAEADLSAGNPKTGSGGPLMANGPGEARVGPRPKEET
jgi:hypothetical protein